MFDRSARHTKVSSTGFRDSEIVVVLFCFFIKHGALLQSLLSSADPGR